MPVKQSDYEALLSEYSNRDGAIALLKNHRPYLEMIPSLRRPNESMIVIPLPIVRIYPPSPALGQSIGSYPPTKEAIRLPCDLAILMCDPEWKIKMGVEILLFIYRPQEDFSNLLSRWRQTQVYLDKDYEWLMPPRDRHIFSEGADRVHPLFVVFEKTPERIKRGLTGACLPFAIQIPELGTSEEMTEVLSDQE